MTETRASTGRLVDVERCKELLRVGTVQQLYTLRADLVSRKKKIEGQLADDTAGLREERAELLSAGMHPREADLRASAGGDHDWRARAAGAQRVCDEWLSRIRARIAELSPPGASRNYSAVSIPGVARDGAVMAAALNQLIAQGCKVISFTVVGDSLVVLASDPGGPT